jgi:hypothetical protein
VLPRWTKFWATRTTTKMVRLCASSSSRLASVSCINRFYPSCLLRQKLPESSNSCKYIRAVNVMGKIGSRHTKSNVDHGKAGASTGSKLRGERDHHDRTRDRGTEQIRGKEKEKGRESEGNNSRTRTKSIKDVERREEVRHAKQRSQGRPSS